MIVFKENHLGDTEYGYPINIILKGVPRTNIDMIVNMTAIYDTDPNESLYSCMVINKDCYEHGVTEEEMRFLMNQFDVVGIKYKVEV